MLKGGEERGAGSGALSTECPTMSTTTEQKTRSWALPPSRPSVWPDLHVPLQAWSRDGVEKQQIPHAAAFSYTDVSSVLQLMPFSKPQ